MTHNVVVFLIEVLVLLYKGNKLEQVVVVEQYLLLVEF